jgi:hypothetical protein
MSEGAEKQAGEQVEAGGVAAPVAVAPAKPSRWWRWTKWLTLLGIIGLLVWWWMPESFPFRVTVELEYQGQPVTLTQINRCTARFEGVSWIGGRHKIWSMALVSMGAHLPDGTGSFGSP